MILMTCIECGARLATTTFPCRCHCGVAYGMGPRQFVEGVVPPLATVVAEPRPGTVWIDGVPHDGFAPGQPRNTPEASVQIVPDGRCPLTDRERAASERLLRLALESSG
jgi:hypothetical protein